MKRRWLILAMSIAPCATQAFEVNGVALGAREDHVRRAMPSAHCKPLEWKSRAADRRCDDAKIRFAGVSAKITVYLKSGTVQAFGLRFDSTHRARVIEQVKGTWGAPASEATETIGRTDRGDRRIYKARWARGDAQALLSVPLDRKRATLSAWRRGFDEEIYRVR